MNLILFLPTFAASLFAADFEWVAEGGGEWSDNANWSQPQFPNASDAELYFLGAITRPSTIAVNGRFATGDLLFDSPISYTLRGGHLLSTGRITVTSGHHSIETHLEKGGETIVDLAAGTALAFERALSGAGDLIKTGAGRLEFTGSASNTYEGATIVNSGQLKLGKMRGAVAIAGDLEVNGGRVEITAADQFSASSNVVIHEGVIALNRQPTTLHSLTYNGGAIQDECGRLVLTSTGTALTMRSTTLSSLVILCGTSGGEVVFDATNPGRARILDLSLGEVVRPFTIHDGAGAAMAVTGIISGAGGIDKRGEGTLELSPAAGNIYSGPTILSAGKLVLTATSGVVAIPGELIIEAGELVSEGADLIADRSDVLQNGGTWRLGAHDETIHSYTFNGGELIQTGGILTLASGANALTMRGTSIPGTVAFTGQEVSTITYDATDGASASIARVNLGRIDRIFSIEQGPHAIDMEIGGGTASGGGLQKEGEGVLSLIGVHDYPGAHCAVREGTLRVSGSLKAETLTIGPKGTLEGHGTVDASIASQGMVAPGSSIGTLALVGDQIFGGSVGIELNPTASDLIDIAGALTIGPGAQLVIAAEEGHYIPNQRFTIIQTTGGITGTFASTTDSLLLFGFQPLYTGQSVLLQVLAFPFSTLELSGNARAMACYLDSLNPPAGSDLAHVIGQLKQLPDRDAMIDALDQLHPASLKGLSQAQETSAIRYRSLILSRMWDPCCSGCCCKTIWIAGMGSVSEQKAVKDLKGFEGHLGHVAVGADRYVDDGGMCGVSGAYSYSHLDWDGKKQEGEIQAISASLYGQWCCSPLLLRGILVGAYNWYDTERRIQFGSIKREAKAAFGGGQVLGYLQGGWETCLCSIAITPYLSVEYSYLQQGQFKEKGAGSVDNVVASTDYHLVRAMGGVHFSRCFEGSCRSYALEVDLAYAREERFGDDTYCAHFIGLPLSYRVRGLRPDRNLFVPEAAFAIFSQQRLFRAKLGYHGEIGSNFCDHAAFAELAMSF